MDPGFCILSTRLEFGLRLHFRKKFQRVENPFNLHGQLHRDKVRTLLGSLWSGLEPCPIHAAKDEASHLTQLSMARDPVENGLFFAELCDCVKERIPYTGIQSVINVMQHLSIWDWHLARHVLLPATGVKCTQWSRSISN